jgi:rubrerythrin
LSLTRVVGSVTVYNTSIDPYVAEETRYECHECGNRFEADTRVGSCPGCGAGAIQNLCVSRE